MTRTYLRLAEGGVVFVPAAGLLQDDVPALTELLHHLVFGLWLWYEKGEKGRAGMILDQMRTHVCIYTHAQTHA